MKDKQLKYGFKIKSEFKNNHQIVKVQDLITEITTEYKLKLEKELYKRLSNYQLKNLIKNAKLELERRKNDVIKTI